jgi:Na+/melibiose symporter-like transporter
MQRLTIRRFQLTIRQVMTAIAVCAVCLWSPMVAVFGSAVIFWWIVILSLIYTRVGRRFAELMLLMIIAVILYALCEPVVESICRGVRSTLPNIAVQRTRSAGR